MAEVESLKNEARVQISVKGELTDLLWSGVFRFKTRISHREQLIRDEYRRRLLGADAEHASQRALNQAELFSEIQAHLIEAPGWWTKTDGGLDLEDDNVIAEIYNGLIKALAEYRQALAAKNEKGKGELKDLAGELGKVPEIQANQS